MKTPIAAQSGDARDSERGFSLIELVLYIVFSSAILLLAAGMFASAFNARTQVLALTTAASEGQLISRSVEEGVRNAAGPAGSTGPAEFGVYAELPTADGSQIMRARVALGDSSGAITWQCQAWYYSSSTTSIFFTRNALGAVPDPGGFTETSPGSYAADDGSANWVLLSDHVRLPATTGQFFGAAGGRVILNFEITNDDVSLVLIPNTVVTRKPAIVGSGPNSCY